MTVAAGPAGGANNETSPFPLIRRFLLLSIISSIAFDFSLKMTLAFVVGGTLAIVSYTYLGASPNAINNTDPSSQQHPSTRSNFHNLPPCSRQPEHCATTAVQNGNNVLRDGLVAFSHTHKPSLDDYLTATTTTTSPQQRLSRLLTALLSDAATRSRTPPPKGSTILISLPHATLSCPHQAAAVATLASHYTVIGIVVLDEKSSPENVNVVLPKDFPLPSHRVVCSTSPAGRIAIGRQLQPQLVLELEASVAGHLERFGHTTVVYDASGGGGGGKAHSPLGRVWLRALE